MALLEVENLRRTFGGITALDRVSFEVEPDQTYAIIGPNGAGKTTLFNCITGYHRPDDGTVVFNNEDITNYPDYETARLGLRRTFQEADIFEELTVAENVSLSSFSTPPEETMEALDLLDIYDKKGEELTLFERKRIALALAADGELLLLDEIFSGLNPAEKPDMIEYLQRLSQSKTLILIEHDIETAFELAEELIVLYQGRVLGRGTPEEIRSDTEIREKYLGERAL